MEASALDDVNLPARTKQKLGELCDQLARALGEDFVGALLYGSAAREDWEEGTSDINLMIVSRRAQLQQCAAITRALRKAQRTLPLHAEIITPQDLQRSADVFPLKFLDIQRNHLVLVGDDPLEGVEIAWDHLRLRVEQELKGVMFTLRRHYLIYEQQPDQLVRTMSEQLSAFLIGLGALMFLRDGQWWLSGKEAIARAVPESFGIDEGVLESLLALKRRELELDAEELQVLYGAFMVAAEEVADIVDRLGEEEDAALEDAEGGEEEALDAKGIGGEPVMPVIEPAVLEEDDEEVSQEAS
jgi:predicted nucleotidyltransferase